MRNNFLQALHSAVKTHSELETPSEFKFKQVMQSIADDLCESASADLDGLHRYWNAFQDDYGLQWCTAKHIQFSKRQEIANYIWFDYLVLGASFYINGSLWSYHDVEPSQDVSVEIEEDNLPF